MHVLILKAAHSFMRIGLFSEAGYSNLLSSSRDITQSLEQCPFEFAFSSTYLLHTLHAAYLHIGYAESAHSSCIMSQNCPTPGFSHKCNLFPTELYPLPHTVSPAP